MRGRAGRKGRDTYGESFVVCRKDDLQAVEKLLTADMPIVSSCLASNNNTHGLCRALLEIISTSLATSPYSIEDYFKSTLLHHTHPVPSSLPELLNSSLASLQSSGLIEDAGCGYWVATKMGTATVRAGFAPDDGVFMYDELSRALQQFNLETDMHIVYEFTPIHGTGAQHGLKIDWKLMRDEIERLDEPSLRAATFVGVDPAYIHKMAQGRKFVETGSPEAVARGRTYRRFYISLMLRRLINEKPVHLVAREFDIARGFVQSLSSTCRGFAATSATYCRAMGWSGLAVLLEHYAWRLDLGVKDDLIELAKLPWVKSATARVFWDCGLRSIEIVSKEGEEKVLEALVMAQPKKLRLRVHEGGIRGKLKGRAEIVVKAAQKLWEQECMVELEE
jgi:replicative superfamily II helicase